ncbi:MAG: DNA-processing protein DprA [bacterium]|nr:DNA-processing protein DprA [bacterium]
MSDAADTHRDLLALCSLTDGGDRCDWGVIARQAHRERTLDALKEGKVIESSERAHRTYWLITTASPVQWASAYDRADAELEAASAHGARMTTVLDDDYPTNLRFIHNLPPFLFYRGVLDPHLDAHSIAVVGTRNATAEGLNRARAMARKLAEHGVSIVSGLARGIDTAAHRAALDAGGRTIAVFGTGINMVYPAENIDLVAEIIDTGGVVVSQFFPTAKPSAWSFPRRNEVTSGISQGTVVIEASQKSGARMQARLAYEHGKQVFLVKSLATSQEWAKKMLDRGRATPVGHFDDLARELVDADQLLRASKELHLEPFAL